MAATRERAPLGRARELERIQKELDEGGLLVEGAPGIGKTTVWLAAVADARRRGVVVLTAAPAEAEQTFSYSVLGDLLETAGDTFEALPAAQRHALEAVLAGGLEEQIDARTVAVAVRTLLGALSADTPFVVAVDDVQWADAASMAAVEFAARRIPSVAVLAAARTGYDLPLRLPLATIELGGLSVGALHHLIVERLGTPLPRTAMLRLHEISGGNAFYALELARANPTYDALELPPSLQRLVSDRIRVLPAPTQRALAELALAGSSPDSAALALAAGIVGRDDRFVHPLFAEAAVALLSQDARRTVHREIAARTTDAEQHARHLAGAAESADEAIAGTLAEAAAANARRGAIAASAELWELAAGLTPPEHGRAMSERLVEAGISHLLAGNHDRASGLIDPHLDALPSGPLRTRALVHQALRLAREDSREVIPVLERALGEAHDRLVRYEITGLLCAFVDLVGDSERSAAIAREYLRSVEREGDDAALEDALLLSASREYACDRPARELIDRARTLAEARVGEKDRAGWSWTPLAATLVREGRFDEAREAVQREFSDEQRVGSVFQDGGILLTLAMLELALGHPENAAPLAEEAAAAGEQIGAPYMVCDARTMIATVAGVLGDVDRARSEAGRALELGEQVRATRAADAARLALGLLELSLGNDERAAAVFETVTDDGLRRLSCQVGGRASLDVIEAFAGTGRVDRATAVAALMPEDARERPVGEALVAAAGGDLERAIELIASAGPSPSSFRRGRELLLQGRLLRQARRRNDAREALNAARELFAAMPAPLWADRADEELARLGGRSPVGAQLTASERQVAELVASGLSNKEVAARLVVTVRTVEAHLSKIYAKVGVTSRTGLAARWPIL